VFNHDDIPMQGDAFISSLNHSTRQHIDTSRRNRMLMSARVDKIKMTNAAQKAIEKSNKIIDRYMCLSSISYFTITAEIHARSLVNFYRQHADRHMNLKFM